MNYVARQSYYYTYIKYHFQEDANDMAHISILEAITWKQLQNILDFIFPLQI